MMTMSPAEFFEDLQTSLKLGQIEARCRDVRPFLPNKIARLEAVLPTLSGDEKECVQHVIRIHKMILFFANELGDLTKNEPAKFAEMARQRLGTMP